MTEIFGLPVHLTEDVEPGKVYICNMKALMDKYWKGAADQDLTSESEAVIVIAHPDTVKENTAV